MEVASAGIGGRAPSVVRFKEVLGAERTAVFLSPSRILPAAAFSADQETPGVQEENDR
jgi:hypothetical protein